jgi:glucosamine-6-phosphate deaminase
MLIIVTKDYKEMSKRAAELVALELNKKPEFNLGLATGSTPVGMYEELVKLYKKKKIDFSKVNAFMLDEYFGISKKDKNSYYYYTHNKILNYVNIKKLNFHVIDSETKNPKKFCKEYDKLIRKNHLDLQILGVGVNGHIGFNEPGSRRHSKTRLIKLTEDTRKINSRFFKNVNEVPKYAFSQGIGTILKAKKIILLADGKNKAIAIRNLVKGKVGKKWPVSFLRKHKNLIVILDKEAGKLIR